MQQQQPIFSFSQTAAPPSYDEVMQSSSGEKVSFQAPNSDIPCSEPSQPGLAFGPTRDATAFAPIHEPQVKYEADGVVSYDPLLNSNADALIHFFQQHCQSRPGMAVRVRGTHVETHLNVTQSRMADGSSRSHMDQERKTVVDFDFSVDVSPYIQNTGMIYTVPDKKGQWMTVEDLAKTYCSSDNKFKAIRLRKHPIWDYNALQRMIVGAIRLSGYRGEISVTFPMKNNKIKVNASSKWSKFAHNSCVRVMCVLSCLWIIACPYYQCAKQSFDHSLRADYQVGISPWSWFQQHYVEIMLGAAFGRRQ